MVAKNRSVTLVWYCKTPRGWRIFPALVETEHGRKIARHGWVIDGGLEKHYPEGRFQLRRFVNGKPVYENLPVKHPRDAVLGLERAQRLEQQNLNGTAKTAGPARILFQNGIKSAIKAYVAHLESKNTLEAARHAETTLNEFVKLSPFIRDVRQISERTLLEYNQALRGRGLSDRTIANKHDRLRWFLRWCKLDIADLPKAPKFEAKLPTIYTAEQIAAIRSAAIAERDDFLAVLVDMALMLGLREQELMFSEWIDLDWTHRTFRVTGKPQRGFRIKDNEQREVPVPTELLTRLRAWRESRPSTALILGTEADRPNRHMLRALKRLAKRAGLNCGRCKGCANALGECREWSLHRFRRTYLTGLLRNGIDARTVQSFAGHSDLTTTLRYLKPAAAPETLAKVDSIKWGA